jgi:hypothetical protein
MIAAGSAFRAKAITVNPPSTVVLVGNLIRLASEAESRDFSVL